MNTLIPPEFYFEVFINLCLFWVLFTLLHTRVLKMDEAKNISFINISGYLILIFIIFFLGLRPISNQFGDTVNYNSTFQRYAAGGEIGIEEGDYVWHLFMKFMSSITSIHTFFLLIVFIYVFPMYQISKTFFKEYWYYSFIMFLVSLSFFSYGVNGIRNGAACSLFLWGVCYSNKNKIIMSSMFLVAVLFHKTAMLPVLAYLLTSVYNNPKNYFKGWLLCIPLSLALGSVWITLFASIGFGDDDRLSGYLTKTAEEGTFSNTGFRWDFLFYSAFAVFSGWYFIYKKKFYDVLYFRLLNTYLICNGFWILVITANYSNRFAYLSWFMMAIVVIYPLLKQKQFKNHHFMLGKVVLAYFSFTYLMSYLYYS